MTVLYSFVLAASVVAGTLAGIRWLRVAQREHYLPFAVTRFARRWWLGDLAHAGAEVLALVGAGASTVDPAYGFVSVAIVAAGPLGLGLRGRTSHLIWTRRMKTLSTVAFLLVGAPLALSCSFGNLRTAAITGVFIAVGMPFVVEAAVLLCAPVEDRLARRFVEQASARVQRVDPTIVAITGSYGKTTTKGYIAHLLAGRYSVLASPKSFNNRAGLARTVNDLLAPGTDVFVAEMGTYGRGEIAALCSWLPPEVAVITAIGPVHLERFKRLEVTLAAKAEIVVGAKTTVLNVDDSRLAVLANDIEQSGRLVVRCSARDPISAVAVIGEDDGVAVLFSGERVGTLHFAPEDRPPALSNVACALGVGLVLGCSASELLERLQNLPVAASRLQATTTDRGVTVIDDTFNSNPAGARIALERLWQSDRRRVVVTPGMVELGSVQFEENAMFGEAIAGIATDLVVVGKTNHRALVTGARRAHPSTGESPNIVTVRTRDDAVEWVRSSLERGDAVLYENDLPDHYR